MLVLCGWIGLVNEVSEVKCQRQLPQLIPRRQPMARRGWKRLKSKFTKSELPLQAQMSSLLKRYTRFAPLLSFCCFLLCTTTNCRQTKNWSLTSHLLIRPTKFALIWFPIDSVFHASNSNCSVPMHSLRLFDIRRFIICIFSECVVCRNETSRECRAQGRAQLYSFDHIPRLFWCVSGVCGFDQRSQGQEASGERPCEDADQNAEDHHEEDALWRRLQDMGQVPDEDTQETRRLDVSSWRGQTDNLHFHWPWSRSWGHHPELTSVSSSDVDDLRNPCNFAAVYEVLHFWHWNLNWTHFAPTFLFIPVSSFCWSSALIEDGSFILDGDELLEEYGFRTPGFYLSLALCSAFIC